MCKTVESKQLHYGLIYFDQSNAISLNSKFHTWPLNADHPGRKTELYCCWVGHVLIVGVFMYTHKCVYCVCLCLCLCLCVGVGVETLIETLLQPYISPQTCLEMFSDFISTPSIRYDIQMIWSLVNDQIINNPTTFCCKQRQRSSVVV